MQVFVTRLRPFSLLERKRLVIPDKGTLICQCPQRQIYDFYLSQTTTHIFDTNRLISGEFFRPGRPARPAFSGVDAVPAVPASNFFTEIEPSINGGGGREEPTQRLFVVYRTTTITTTTGTSYSTLTSYKFVHNISISQFSQHFNRI